MTELLVLDTSILIDHERGSTAAMEVVSDLLRRNVAALHPVTAVEVIYGARDRPHLAQVLAMIKPFRSLAVRNVDFTTARALLERHVLATRIGWPDWVIAATCLRIGAPILTLNERDFGAIKGVKTLRPC